MHRYSCPEPLRLRVVEHAVQAMMVETRRRFLRASAAATLAAAAGPLRAAKPRSIRAVAFDGLAVFDPRPVALAAERLFPGRGELLMAHWRTRQFEYTWLRNAMDRYADFEQVTEDALRFAAQAAKVDLTRDARSRLMEAFGAIHAWDDVAPVLRRLKSAGLRLVLLSNFTRRMLERASANSGFANLFEPHLSTDLAQAFKPDRRAYALAPRALAMAREEIAFVAFGGWDAAGARAFGFPTYWATRAGAPTEELGVRPDFIARGLEALPSFVGTNAA